MEGLNPRSMDNNTAYQSQPLDDDKNEIRNLEPRENQVGQVGINLLSLIKEESAHLGEVLKKIKSEKSSIEGKVAVLKNRTSGVMGFFYRILSPSSYKENLFKLDQIKNKLSSLEEDIKSVEKAKSPFDKEVEGRARLLKSIKAATQELLNRRSLATLELPTKERKDTDTESLSSRSSSPGPSGDESPSAGGSLAAMLAKRAQGGNAGRPVGRESGVSSASAPPTQEGGQAANESNEKMTEIKDALAKLRKVGMPEPAIRQKLVKDKFSQELIDAALSGSSTSAAPSQKAVVTEDTRKFAGEPEEPEGISRDWKESKRQAQGSTKEELTDQISKIKNYIEGLKKSLKPIRETISRLKDQKQVLKNQEEAVSYIKDVIENREAVIKQLEDSQEDLIIIHLKNPTSPHEKEITIPCFSESKLEESNNQITGERLKIPNTCLISKMKLSLTQELESGLPDKLGVLGTSLLKQKEELESEYETTQQLVKSLEGSQSNGIPFNEYEQLLKVKEQKIATWENISSIREGTLKNFGKAGSSKVSDSEKGSATDLGASSQIKDKGVEAFQTIDVAGMAFLKSLNPAVIPDNFDRSPSNDSKESTIGQLLQKGIKESAATWRGVGVDPINSGTDSDEDEEWDL